MLKRKENMIKNENNMNINANILRRRVFLVQENRDKSNIFEVESSIIFSITSKKQREKGFKDTIE